jgi:hypothetical protein
MSSAVEAETKTRTAPSKGRTQLKEKMNVPIKFDVDGLGFYKLIVASLDFLISLKGRIKENRQLVCRCTYVDAPFHSIDAQKQHTKHSKAGRRIGLELLWKMQILERFQ